MYAICIAGCLYYYICIIFSLYVCMYVCTQVSSTGDQPRINIESPGINKLLDPYTTTTNLTYIPHTPNQLEISRKYITTYYDASKTAKLTSHYGKKPMKDDLIFKADVKGRIVPKLVYRVPYRYVVFLF